MRRTAWAAALGLAAAACASSVPIPPERPGAAGASYVGRAACSTCHAALAASFARTGMGRSFYPMAGHVVEPFGRTIEVPRQGLRYTMFEKDGRYFQKQFQAGPGAEEINVDVREMVWVVGSGNHSRSYATEHEGRLYQTPVCWYPGAGTWDLCPGYETTNEHFQRAMDGTCLFCHNARMEPSGRFENSFGEPYPHGIDCERCHGPGSLHVARWASPAGEDARPVEASRGSRADPTIVNPRRLPPDLAIQVCMQCHLADASQTERVTRPGRDPLSWRPGEPLHGVASVYAYRQRLPGHFGLGAQADRLVLSRCFVESGGALQCITCHDPHVEVYEVSRDDPGRFSDTCAGCHGRDGCALPAARRGDDCVACHMRRAEPHDHRHTRFLDHWIRRRPFDDLERTRTDFTMEPVLPEDPDQSAAERATNLGRATLYKKIGTAEGRAMSWDLPLSSLAEAARLEPGFAPAHFYLGKLEMSRGRPALAEPHFLRAVASEPGMVDAWQELGSALYAQGRLEEAASALEKALALGPRGDDEGAVHNELARVRMEQGRLDEAGRRLEAALELEPFSPEVHANDGVLRSLRGDGLAAVRSYREALRHAPNHPALHRFLARELAREGAQRDLDAAIAAARRAVELSPGDGLARRTLEEACRAAGRANCSAGPAR